MSTDERYNGWANRETWAVALYLNNDQGWQEDCHDLIHAGRNAHGWHRGNDFDTFHAGEVIREYVEVLAYSVSEGTADQDTRLAVLGIGSLWRVDWREIGASFLEDVS